MDEADHYSLPSAQVVRTTQRMPRSCIPCARRKIKCSKTVPCDPCIRRGESLTCAREIVRVNGKVTVAVDSDGDAGSPGGKPGSYDRILIENSALRDRVKQLESLLTQDFGNGPGFMSSKPQLGLPEVEEGVLDTFDILHLGLQPDGLTSAASFAPEPASGRLDLLSLLPIRKSSEKIVRFSLEMLGWIHCALSPQDFLLEHDQFWSALEAHDRTVLSNHTWTALYLSVLAAGAYFMDEEDGVDLHYLHEGFSGRSRPTSVSNSEGMLQISHAWYNAVFQELDLANYLSKPKLGTVQTLAICTTLHRNFGQPDREYVLLGVAINVARTLGMDRLGSEATCPKHLKTRVEWATWSRRELGRRLWWTLVICDWMTVFSRPASISSHSFTTVLSVDEVESQTDVIMGVDPTTGPSPPSALHYHLVMSKIAQVIYFQVKAGEEKSTSNICRALQAINSIANSLPAHLAPDNQEPLHLLQDSMWPWIPVQRNSLASVLQACRINICLAYFPRYLDTREDKFCIHDRGLDAAKNAIEQRQCTRSLQVFSKLWGVSACLLAAGIYIALDLICFRDSKPSHAQDVAHTLIERCVSSFDHGERFSALGNARSMILKRLLYLKSMWTESHPVDEGTISRILDAVGNNSASSFDTTVVKDAALPQVWTENLLICPVDNQSFDAASIQALQSVSAGPSLDFHNIEHGDANNLDFQIGMLHSVMNGNIGAYEQQSFGQFWNTDCIE